MNCGWPSAACPPSVELDEATTDHPVLLLARRAQRGAQLRRAARWPGIGRDTPDMPGGFIARDAAGDPSRLAAGRGARIRPPRAAAAPEQALAAGLAQASARYAAHGLGTVRDPPSPAAQWHAYLRAQAAGQLSVRSHAMIFSTPAAIAAAGSVDAYLDALEDAGHQAGRRRRPLRLWGLKFVLDGGVEAAALEQPYADRPGYHGELMWDRDDLADALAACARRGWPVGTHAMGDRAVSVLLDAIRDARERAGTVPAGMLVIEHGGLIAGPHRRRCGPRRAHHRPAGPARRARRRRSSARGAPDRTGGAVPLARARRRWAPGSAPDTDHPIGPLSPLARSTA